MSYQKCEECGVRLAYWKFKILEGKRVCKKCYEELINERKKYLEDSICMYESDIEIFKDQLSQFVESEEYFMSCGEYEEAEELLELECDLMNAEYALKRTKKEYEELLKENCNNG